MTTAQQVAELILANATSGSASWDELNGPDATLRKIHDHKFLIEIEQPDYDSGNPRLPVQITVES
jgi:hypothetical protein